jgi:hypothetical protein
VIDDHTPSRGNVEDFFLGRRVSSARDAAVAAGTLLMASAASNLLIG